MNWKAHIITLVIVVVGMIIATVVMAQMAKKGMLGMGSHEQAPLKKVA